MTSSVEPSELNHLVAVYYSTQIDEMPMNVADLIS